MNRRPVIPYVSRAPAAAQADWIAALAAAFPEGDIVPLVACDPADCAQARVALVANPAPADLARLPRLQWVHSLWAGVEGLLGELPADGPLIVRLTDPQLAQTMAEAVLAWTLYLHRDMPAYAVAQRARRWQPRPVVRAAARTVAVLGLGQLGAAAAGVLVRHGFSVLGWARHARPLAGVEVFSGPAGLATVLQCADILVNLLPLTPETRRLLDAERLTQCRSGACLINFGRAAVIDTAALLAALASGHLAHAVLDVFDEEPLPPDSPLWAHPAITVLPHISAPTDKASAAQIVAGNLRAYFQSGTVPPTVNRERGY